MLIYNTVTSLSPQKVMKISRFDEIFVAKCANIFRLCSTLDYLRMFCVPFGHKPCVLKIPLLWPKATPYDICLTTKIRMFRKRSIPLENHLWPSRLRYISTLRYCILHKASSSNTRTWGRRDALFEIATLPEALALLRFALARAFFLPLPPSPQTTACFQRWPPQPPDPEHLRDPHARDGTPRRGRPFGPSFGH